MTFVPNPQFMPHVERAVMFALNDAGKDIEAKAKNNTRHASIARTIWASPPSRDGQGPVVTVRYKKGLGPIFEGGTVQRRLKGKGKYRAGTNRGAIQPPERALGRAADSVISRGLDLHRYL